jgi:hypothetical protein
MDYMEIRALLEQHQKSDLALVRAQGGNNDIHYARMSGFLSATVAGMMRDLPADRQRFHRELLEIAIDRNEKETVVANLKGNDIERIIDPLEAL